ncbi:hypothetical protein HHI36_013315 [Cryptolaemus montrouzieri]|uniref:Uncharacterized protein n=1 Tax=Cryptolaemus montrouzieri TaxID=559131 RepID=A0ABD2NH95_9CUCU
MELSIEKNSTIDCELDTNEENSISSLHAGTENKNDQVTTDPTVQVQTVSVIIHSSPEALAETCLSKITTSNRNQASSIIDTNENDSFPDLPLSRYIFLAVNSTSTLWCP